MFCGILAALCGATWDEIAADYQLSNRMGIQEFRDYHLLQYSFQKMLDVEDISQVPDISAAVTSYFVDKQILTSGEIAMLKETNVINRHHAPWLLPRSTGNLRLRKANLLTREKWEQP